MRRLGFLLVSVLILQGCGSPSLTRARLLPSNGQAVAVNPPAASDLTPQSQATLYLDVVEGLIKQTRHGAALAFLDDYAVKQNSLTPRYWLLRGDALQGMNRGAEAMLVYAKLDATSLSAQGWNGKGRVVAARKQWRAAAAHFQNAVAAEPSNADFLNDLAFADMHSGQFSQAAGYLRQAHELNPGSALIRNNLIIALMLHGDRAGADGILRGIPSDTERAKAVAIAKSAIQDHAFGGEGKPS